MVVPGALGWMSSQKQSNEVDSTGALGRLTSRLAGLAWDNPRWFLIAGLILTLISGVYAASRLRFMTNRNDMISSAKPVQQRW